MSQPGHIELRRDLVKNCDRYMVRFADIAASRLHECSGDGMSAMGSAVKKASREALHLSGFSPE
ncbi:hypothetical protein [Polaromonas sp. YR568]|uniref:hypothetical protein n=1 Tax=Polaromonas sp. YR568 TaxID=1855301 RepID=UPI00398C1670